MEEQLKQFLEFIEKDKKLSNNTLQSYRRDLYQYQSYINSNNKKYNKMKEEDIKEYIQY